MAGLISRIAVQWDRAMDGARDGRLRGIVWLKRMSSTTTGRLQLGDWMQGERLLLPRPFGKEPKLPSGVFDSHDRPVTPSSLYLSQLAERLGPSALKKIGY